MGVTRISIQIHISRFFLICQVMIKKLKLDLTFLIKIAMVNITLLKETPQNRMNLSVDRTALLEELMFLSRIIQKKQSNFLLSNILITSECDETVTLSCSDGFSTLSTKLRAEFLQPVKFCMSSVKLLDVVRSLDDGTVTLKLKDNNWVNVRSGKAVLNVPGIDPSRYPTPTEFLAEKSSAISIAAGVLDDLISKTSFVVPTSLTHTKYVLNGINFSFTDKTVIAAAVDGNRLAVLSAVLLKHSPEESSFLLAKESFNDVLKLTRNLSTDTEVKITISQNQLTFEGGSRLLSCRRLVGTFPDYKPMFPAGDLINSECNSLLLRNALNRAFSLSDDEGKAVVLAFREGEIEVQTSGANGNLSEKLYATYTGNEETIALNARYLLEFLRSAPEDAHDRITFKLTSASRPIELNLSAVNTYRYVVMPRKLPDAAKSSGDKVGQSKNT